MDRKRGTFRRACVLASTAATIAIATVLPVAVASAAQADCTRPGFAFYIGGIDDGGQTMCRCPPGNLGYATGNHSGGNPEYICREEISNPLPPPPVDQVRMKITTSLGMAHVAITNLSDLSGTCAYDASDTKGILPSVHRDVDIAPKGRAPIDDLLAPPLLSTYHVVLSCKGDFNGKQVEFGHVEEDVSSF
jgi:hypothetical protein